MMNEPYEMIPNIKSDKNYIELYHYCYFLQASIFPANPSTSLNSNRTLIGFESSKQKYNFESRLVIYGEVRDVIAGTLFPEI